MSGHCRRTWPPARTGHLADPVDAGDADLLHELRELLGEGRCDAVPFTHRRQVEAAVPDPLQARGGYLVVAAVNTLKLELIEPAHEVLSRQEDDRLDARDRVLDVELPGGPFELVFELLALGVGEVQRVLDRPQLVAVTEQPSRAVVRRGARWLLISTRYRPPGVAMKRSTSLTWPLLAVNVNVCQAPYGSASGIRALMKSRASCSQGKEERWPCHRCDSPLMPFT
jgi:hypothetical protein